MIYKSCLRRDVILPLERKKHIFLFHPDFKPYFSEVKQVLLKPDDIRISKSDPDVLLLYKYFSNIQNGKYITVVVKFNHRNFVLTAYLTKRKLSGEKYEI